MMLSFDGQALTETRIRAILNWILRFSVPIAAAGFCVGTFSDFNLTTMSMCTLFFIVRIPASHVLY
jgi:hypothetical protein